MSAAPAWEHFQHEADIGIRGWGSTQAEAFAAAAVALTAVLTAPTGVRIESSVVISVTDTDPELLLVRFLNAMVYEMATRRMLFGRVEVNIDGDELRATLHGEAVDRSRHQPAVEVKGATLTELRVVRGGRGWCAQCVVDV